MDSIVYRLMYKSELNHWWDKAKRKIVFSLVKKYYKSSNTRPKILDIGCGMGVLAKEAENLGEYYGIDISQKAVEFCKKRGVQNVKQGEATDIPYEDNQFDIVLTLDAIEHVEDDTRVLDEIRRVARPGGMVIVTAPAFQFLWGPTDVINQHFRRYRLKDLRLKFKQKSFSILKSSYYNTFLFLPIVLVRMAVKYLHFPVKSEHDMSRKIVNDIWIINKILYYIFVLESFFLKFINFPFGVSVIIVARK